MSQTQIALNLQNSINITNNLHISYKIGLETVKFGRHLITALHYQLLSFCLYVSQTQIDLNLQNSINITNNQHRPYKIGLETVKFGRHLITALQNQLLSFCRYISQTQIALNLQNSINITNNLHRPYKIELETVKFGRHLITALQNQLLSFCRYIWQTQIDLNLQNSINITNNQHRPYKIGLETVKFGRHLITALQNQLLSFCRYISQTQIALNLQNSINITNNLHRPYTIGLETVKFGRHLITALQNQLLSFCRYISQTQIALNLQNSINITNNLHRAYKIGLETVKFGRHLITDSQNQLLSFCRYISQTQIALNLQNSINITNNLHRPYKIGLENVKFGRHLITALQNQLLSFCRYVLQTQIDLNLQNSINITNNLHRPYKIGLETVKFGRHLITALQNQLLSFCRFVSQTQIDSNLQNSINIT